MQETKKNTMTEKHSVEPNGQIFQKKQKQFILKMDNVQFEDIQNIERVNKN